MTEFYYEFYDEIKENSLFGIYLLDEKPSLLDEMTWFVEFQKTCAKGDAIGLIAELEDEMVGFCGVWRRTPRSPGSHRGQFAAHAVKKEHRGKGNPVSNVKGLHSVYTCQWFSSALTVV